jgi:hypothetical protein
MDFSHAQTPPANPVRGLAAAGLAILALALYALLLSRNEGAVAGGSDSSGYMNQARLLDAGSVHVQPRTVDGLPAAAMPPYFYIPLGFRPAPNGNGMVPTYPAGFSLFVVALRPLAGWRHAGDVTMILNALAGLAATYALGRMLGLERHWSALGAAMVGLSPLYIYMSVQAMTDVPSLAWTTLAVVAALKSRKRPAWAVTAGAAVAVDVLLRPTNVLVFIPIAIALGASPRRWILLGLGGLPGAVFSCAHGLAAYGSLVATGYGDVTVDFSWSNIPGALLQFVRWFPLLFTPVIALCLGLPWLTSSSRRTRWMLGTWIAVYAAFYLPYRFVHEAWWYLRFLLPMAPAMVIGGLLVLRALLARISSPYAKAWSILVFAASVVLVAVGSFALNRTLHATSVGKIELTYPQLTDWMEKNVPHDAVCLSMQASGALEYYTDYTFIRWDFIDKGNVAQVESAIRKSGRPLYAVLFPLEYNDAHLPERAMPGRWTEVGAIKYVRILRRDFDAPKS